MFDHIAWAVLGPGDFWYAVPLIVAVSLVYAATRYEQTEMILHHALRTAVWIVGLMVMVFVVLWLMTWWV